MKRDIYILFLLLTCFSTFSWGATITTKGLVSAYGDWNEAKAWDLGRIPGADDDVVIAHDITLPSGFQATVKSLTIQHRTLTLNGTLTVTGQVYMEDNILFDVPKINISGTLTINGDISNSGGTRQNGQVNVHQNGTFNFYGSKFTNGNLTIDVEGKMNSYNNVEISGTTFTINGTYDILGDFNNQGNIQTGDYGTIGLKGNVRQNIDGSQFTIAKLYMKNAAGVNQNTTIKVSNQLFMRLGVIYVKDDCYLMTTNKTDESTGSLEATNQDSYVDGMLVRDITENRTFLFPVGHDGESAFAAVKNAQKLGEGSAYGVRYYKGKADVGTDNSYYPYLGNGYWEVDNRGDLLLTENSVKAKNMEFRLPKSHIDFLYNNGAGLISAMFSYNTNDKSPAWVLCSTANLNDNEKLYSDNIVLAYKSDSSEGIEIKKNKPCYFAYGINPEATDPNKEVVGISIVVEKEIDGTWTGVAEDNNWNHSSNWLSEKVPTTDAVIKKSYFKHEINRTIVTYSDGSTEDITPESKYESYDVKWFPSIDYGQQALLTGNLKIEDGAQMAVNGGFMKVDGNINVNDGAQLNVNNRYDQSSALMFGTYTGKVTVNRTFEALRTYYVGSATIEGMVSGLSNPLYSDVNKFGDILKVYNAGTRKFDYSDRFDISTCGSYNASKKYHNSQSEVTLTQIGTPYNHDGNASNKIMLASTDDTWNIIQNPYLLSLPVDKGYDAITLGESVLKTIWIRGYNSTSKYHFTTYNFGSDVAVTEVGEIKAANDGSAPTAIAPQQGIYVYTVTADENNYVKFNPKAVTTNVNSTLKSTKVRNNVLRLRISSGGLYSDETALVFDTQGSTSHISHDSPKMLNTSSTEYSQIFTIKNQNELSAIGIFPLTDQMLETPIPLGIRATKLTNQLTIEAVGIDDFDNSVDVYLCDGDKRVNLRNENYNFQAESGLKNESRFTLRLYAAESGAATTLDESHDVFRIDTKNGCLIVDAGNVETNIAIYDMAGRKVHQLQTNAAKRLKLAKGVYIVEATTDSRIFTRKIAL